MMNGDGGRMEDGWDTWAGEGVYDSPNCRVRGVDVSRKLGNVIDSACEAKVWSTDQTAVALVAQEREGV